MTAVNKIDSNCTGLRYAEELSIGVLPGSPVWIPLEPNSYDDFGGEITTVARNPINSGRQRQKGVTVDLDASGGFNTDLTQTNLADLLQGFMFANARVKTEFGGTSEVTGVTVGPATFTAASGLDAFDAGDIVKGSGFTEAANNGVHVVTTAVAATLTVGATTAIETPPAAAKLVTVGFSSAAGDLDVDATGTLPAITSTILDFTTLDLVPGEWIFIGGDVSGAAGDQFLTPANNGYARIHTIAANRLEFDKTQDTMVTEANTAELVKLFFGRTVKNESDKATQVRRSYHLERELGAPDDALPAQIQGEYVKGAVPNELTLNFGTADKVTVDLSFVGTDHETVTGVVGLKSGTRPALVVSDAFNTSNHFARLKLSLLDRTVGSNPTALFGFLTEFNVTINNNVTPNKAISVLGAFDQTAGQFEVDGDATAYFSDVTAVAAVRNNSDVTLDFILAKNNTGVVVDIPLIALGDGRLSVEQDEPITLPLETGAAADAVFNHTLLISFFDYLPTAAM
jgi:hypothetical protein